MIKKETEIEKKNADIMGTLYGIHAGSEQLLRKRNPVKTLLLARDILSGTLHVKF